MSPFVETASTPEPIQAVGWILVALGLKALLPCCLSSKATHNPLVFPVPLQLETAFLMLPDYAAASFLTPAGQSSVLSCAHVTRSHGPISIAQDPQVVEGQSP